MLNLFLLNCVLNRFKFDLVNNKELYLKLFKTKGLQSKLKNQRHWYNLPLFKVLNWGSFHEKRGIIQIFKIEFVFGIVKKYGDKNEKLIKNLCDFSRPKEKTNFPQILLISSDWKQIKTDWN